MLDWYMSVRRLIRSINSKALDALLAYKEDGEVASNPIKKYIQTDYDQLVSLWHQIFPEEHLGNLTRHIRFGMDCDYADMIAHDLPELDVRAEKHFLESDKTTVAESVGFEELLHPVVIKSSLSQYHSGHYRDAVLNSVVAIFDYIRDRTGETLDGDGLIGKVMSPNNPLLVLSNLDGESGLNDQKGFMQIYKGVYQGVRNPKSHTLDHDLTAMKAAQYLVFASLLARRIESASVVK